MRESALNAVGALVEQNGLRSIAMSQVAEQAGIGRATLYKYFPNVEAILVAWHERQVTRHLKQLVEVGNQSGTPGERLEAVLMTYALISHQQRHGAEVAALLHRGKHIARAHRHLHDFVRDLLTEGAKTGNFRDDVASDELASYCLHALAAAGRLSSKAAVRRLVMVTLAGLDPHTDS